MKERNIYIIAMLFLVLSAIIETKMILPSNAESSIFCGLYDAEIVEYNGYGNNSGWPSAESGIYAILVKSSDTHYEISIVEKKATDLEYHETASNSNILFNDLIPSNLFVDLVEDSECQSNYSFSYGYEGIDYYIQIDWLKKENSDWFLSDLQYFDYSKNQYSEYRYDEQNLQYITVIDHPLYTEEVSEEKYVIKNESMSPLLFSDFDLAMEFYKLFKIEDT